MRNYREKQVQYTIMIDREKYGEELFIHCAKACNEIIYLIEKHVLDIYDSKPGYFDVTDILPLVGAMLAAYSITKSYRVQEIAGKKQVRKEMTKFVTMTAEELVEKEFWVGGFRH